VRELRGRDSVERSRGAEWGGHLGLEIRKGERGKSEN